MNKIEFTNCVDRQNQIQISRPMFKKDQGKEIVEEYIECQSIVKRYIKGNLLGKGGFAKCYEFISVQTNRKYAAKIIQKSSLTKPKAKQKLQSEIKIHKSLHHHQVVNFQHFFEDEEYVYILLEICRPETLNDLLKRRKRITQFQAKYYIYQITQALKYIHAKKIIHRDLKLGNLFLTDQLHIKVGDFGLATKLNFDSERKKTTCGTPNYLAPQILSSKNGHSYEVDIWSIGIVLYALIFGRPPFETNDLKLTYSKIKSCNYSFPDNMSASSSVKKLITKILQLQPHKRPTLDQILSDQFICSIQIPKSLPLATISIPPSVNLTKKYEKITQTNNDSYHLKIHAQETGIQNSYRTLDKQKIMMSSDKLQTFDKKNSFLKKNTSQQNLFMHRAASTAGLLQRKKGSSIPKQILVNKQFSKQNIIPSRVIYYQENPKFGICYMLSTNAFGMRYNDSTCIISNTLLSQFKYLTLESNFKQISSEIYPFSQPHQNLSKKVKILNHYVKELKKKKIQVESKMSNQIRIQLEKMRPKEIPQNNMKTYVVRSLKTSKAQFFQFNNDLVQVIFEDTSELVFLNQSHLIFSRQQNNLVTYITKFSELKQFNFSSFELESEDIKKRMNYALSVIGRVKKSLESKEINSKENILPSQQSTNHSIQKDMQIVSRSASTMKLMMQSTQSSLNKDSNRHFNSTTKLTTTKIAYPNIGPIALKEISNRLH